MRRRPPLPLPLPRTNPPSPPIGQTPHRPRSHRRMARLPSTLRPPPRRGAQGRRHRLLRPRNPLPPPRMVLRHPPRIPLPIPGILSIPHHHLHRGGQGGGRSGQESRGSHAGCDGSVGTKPRCVGGGDCVVLPPSSRCRGDEIEIRERDVSLPRVLFERDFESFGVFVGGLQGEHCGVGCDLRSGGRVGGGGGGYEESRGVGEWGVSREVEFDVSCGC
mmetsp:Transcript_9574/g.20196  ORF Transcript_9574/g.20196 Transcript_9574/m.20196 type:complete len:218 (+) Transcript_9574:228-881(+)